MRAALSWAILVVAASGCGVRIDGDGVPSTDVAIGGNVDATDSSPPTDASGACVPFCNKLETCGLVASSAVANCVHFCENQYQANPQVTADGCNCVVDDFCFSSVKEAAGFCSGAPIPPN